MVLLIIPLRLMFYYCPIVIAFGIWVEMLLLLSFKACNRYYRAFLSLD